MRNNLALSVVVALLLLSLMGTTYASYTGIGLTNLASPSARQGRTGGPGVIGGGPGSGK
jgi:hypothetical protein